MEISIIIGFVLAGLHLSLIVLVVLAILSGKESDWPMFWMYFFIIDFPLGFLYNALCYLPFLPLRRQLIPGIDSPLNDFVNFLFPLLFFSIVGTAWWFYIPVFIGRLL